MARATEFTTYINTALGASDQVWARYVATGEAAYARLSRAAVAASRASAGLTGGRGTAGLNSGAARATRQLADIERARTIAYRSSARAAADNSAATERQGRIALATAAKNGILAKSLEASAASFRIAQGQLGPVAGRVAAVGQAIAQLSGLQTGLAAAGAALIGFVTTANRFAEVRSKLAPYYESQKEANAALQDVVGIANRSRQALAPIADLYVKITQAGKEFGISQQRAGRISELAAKAATLSGGAPESQNAALTQFTQAIGSNRLGGDELRSVREGAFQLAEAIRKGLGATNAEFAKMAENGELTSDRVASALEASAGRIETAYSRLPRTMASATTQFVNNLLVMTGSIDRALGLTSALAGGLGFISDNLKLIALLATGVAARFAAIKAVSFAGEAAAGARQFLIMQAAVTELSKRRQAEALVANQAAAEKVRDLQDERLAIFRNIAALEQEAQERARIANLANRNAAAGFPGAQVGGGIVSQAKANEDLARATTKLSAEQAKASVNANRLAAAQATLGTTTTRYNTLATAAASRTSLLGRGFSALLGAVNPLGLAIGLATTALIAWVSSTNRAQQALDDYIAKQRQLKNETDDATRALRQQDETLARRAVRAAGKDAKDAATQLRNARLSLAGGLQSLAGQSGFFGNRDRDDLTSIADRLRTGAVSIKAARDEIENIRKRSPGLFKGNAVQSLLGFDPEEIDARLETAEGSLQVLHDFNKGLADAKKDLTTALNTPVEVKRAKTLPSQSVAALQAQAQVSAYDDGTHALKEASARRRAALEALDNEFQVKSGKVPGDKADAYRDRVGQIEQSYKLEVDAAKAQKAAAAQALRDQRQQARESKQLATAQETAQERIARIRERFDDAPRLQDEAQQALRYLDEQIAKYGQLSDAASKARTAEAQAAKQVVEGALDKPYRDYIRQQEQGLAVQRLILQGRTAEADALGVIFDLTERMVPLTDAQKQSILAMAEAQERAARALEDQRRLVSIYTSAVTDAQQTFESFLSNLRTSPGKAFKNLGKELKDNLANLQIRLVSDKLFGGLQREIEDMVNGRSGVRSANDFLRSETTRAGEAAKSFADVINDATRAIDSGIGGSGTISTGVGAAAPSIPGIAESIAESLAQEMGEIVVTANKPSPQRSSGTAATLPTALESIRRINERMVANLERVLGVKLPKSVQGVLVEGLTGYAQAGPVGAVLGGLKGIKGLPEKLDSLLGVKGSLTKALGGAATGSMAAGVMKALGIKTSTTGAQLGGAIGSFIPIPGGEIIGSIAGGLIGGLLKKHKVGSANLTGPDESGVSYSGNSGSRKDTAKGLASNVLDNLNQIAEALGGTVGSFSTSIGVSGDSYHVDPTGQGKLRKSQGGLDFNDDAQAAIAAAVEDAVADGAITGISEASKRILQSGKDLQRAIEKATVIESIPKRLLQLTDPVRYAVTELNDEFSKMISYLQEGGASAQQFADAQKLYDLERAKAIEEATAQASSALQDFLNQMTGSSSSPLSKRDVYSNSRSEVEAFANQMNAGKPFDENKFIDAAQRFDAASEALYGSSSQRFSDFDTIHDLVNRALANQSATGTTPTGQLPASPFTEDVMRQALQATSKEQVDATNNQTQVLSSQLEKVIDQLRQANGNRASASVPGATVGLLPGFAGRTR